MATPHPSQKQLKHTLRNLKYKNAGSAAKNITAVTELFKDLKPSVREYVYPDGQKVDMMQLSGTVPITTNGQMCTVPVRIWIQHGNPGTPERSKPIVFVNPTPNMAIAPVRYINESGRVELEYLREWREGKSNLTALVQAMCAQFSIQCPVYTTTHHTLPQSYGRQREQASRQLSYIQSSSPISAISHNPLAMQLELVRNQEEIMNLQQRLQDAYTQLEEERSKPRSPSNSEEVASLQQQLKDEKRHKEHTEQRLEEIASRLVIVREELEEEKAEKEPLQLTLHSTEAELSQAKNGMLQLKAEKEEFQQSLYSTMSELGRVRERAQQLQDENENLQQKVNAATTELARGIARLSQAKAEVQVLKEDYQLVMIDRYANNQGTKTGLEKSQDHQPSGKLSEKVQEDGPPFTSAETSADIEELSEKLSKMVQVDVSPTISDKMVQVDVSPAISEKVIKMVQVDVSPAISDKMVQVDVSPAISEKVIKMVQVDVSPAISDKMVQVDVSPAISEKVIKMVQVDVSPPTSTSADMEEPSEKMVQVDVSPEISASADIEEPSEKMVQVDVSPEISASTDIEELRTQLKNSQECEEETKAKLETIETKCEELMNSFLAQINMTTEMENHHTSQMENLQRQLQEAHKKITELESSTQSSEPQISSKNVVSSKEVELFRDRVLGTGAWGFVVEGKFRGKAVAIKCLHQEILSQFTVGQIQREISIMADLRHPNLVLFIAAILDDHSSPRIITELLSITLRRAYHENKITQANKLPILHELASALNYLHLHYKPIIHRDVSSTNVLLEKIANDMWKAKLSDFGSANLVRVATTPGEGALVYAAPEMCINAHSPQAPSVDVYSYGILVCEVTTSTFPDHASFNGLMQLLQSQWPDMYRITEQCTRKSPDERPTMQNIISQLDSLIAVETQ